MRVTAVKTLWMGLLLARAGIVPNLGTSVYWSKAPLDTGFTFDLAGWSELASVVRSEGVLRRLLQIPVEAELVSYSDPKKSVFRYAGLMGGRLEACLFLAPTGAVLPSADAAARFLGCTIEPAERLSLLAASEPHQLAVKEKIICSCFSVDGNRIASTIRERNLKTAAEIGAALKAGTNCGSCVPELKKLLRDAARERPAELGEVGKR